ncbi:MAG: hypothetical protein ACFFDW_08040 [Candidatus Thorarchaeota archaeon]
MARTTLKWILGSILTVIGFFIAGVVVIGYLNFLNGTGSYSNNQGGLISGIVIGSLFYIPGIIFLILGMIDVSHNAFDLRMSKLLEEYDRITPVDLAEKAKTSQDRVTKSVSRIIEKGLIIVFFDKATGEFVTQEGRAIAERILGMVKSKRRITLELLSEESGMSIDEIKRIIIGMEKRGMFDGTYDWKSGKILSKEGKEQLAVAKTSCPNCGASLPEPPLPGEQINCEFCGKTVTG